VNKKTLIQPEDIFSGTGKANRKYAKIRTVEQEYGIGRWALFQLIRADLINAPLVKPTRKGKGFRVVELASLEDYLSKH
jgi:hypothetical protein